LFTSFESLNLADYVHKIDISSALLAGMSALSKGGGGPASSDVQGSETRGEASGPMASQFQFSTLGFRRSRQQSRKEQQAHTTGPVSPKKRKVDIDAAFSAHDDISTLLQEIKSATASARNSQPSSTNFG
jgi:hypothetical protein